MENKRKIKTDEYYTPPKVYEAVKNWVCAEYGIDERQIVRPFWPGGDYENFEYPQGCVVLDNPPFSFLSKIQTYFEQRMIRYFLFAPGNVLTAIANHNAACCIICDASIKYHNGEYVKTNFVTNMAGGAIVAETRPDLTDAVNNAMNDNAREAPKEKPRYIYNENMISAAGLQKLAGHGVRFAVKRDDCVFVRRLDAQKNHGKGIYGGGLLLSERAAAERVSAERAAAIRWDLSEREWEIVRRIGANEETEGKA